jgi:branched-subunit amino acid ABC-type transport system permease component
LKLPPDAEIDPNSFSYNDLVGIDRWEQFTPIFGSLTVVGATNYTGRYRDLGRSVQFQVTFSAAVSIASVAGTDYLNLPRTAKGIAGIATMTNETTNIAVGVCHIDVSTSRCYLPTQIASGNVFTLCGSYER